MPRLSILLLLGALWSCGTSPDPSPTIRVLTWNIHHGRGLDDRVDIDRIAARIEESGADLVALQEVDRGVLRSNRRDIAEELARRLGMTAVFGKNIDFQGGDYGNAVLSRFEVLAQDNHHYEMVREGEQRGLLTVVVDSPAGPLRLWNTHLDYRGDDAERVVHTEYVLARVEAEPGPPLIVCGDFNDRPGSAPYGVMTRHFTDAWTAAGDGEGHTYPAGEPDRRIDWVMLGPEVQAVAAEVLESDASDHLPVLVVVRIVEP